jgi:hypothetical protein
VFDAGGGTVVVTGEFDQSGGQVLLNGGILDVGASYQETGGSIDLGQGTLIVSGGLVIGSGALLTGSGTVEADVTNNGTIEVGGMYTVGTIIIAADSSRGIYGNFTQTTGMLGMDMVSASSFDQLCIAGAAQFGGYLDDRWLGADPPDYSSSPYSLITYGSRLNNSQFNGIAPLVFSDRHFEAHYDDPADPNALSLWVVPS